MSHYMRRAVSRQPNSTTLAKRSRAHIAGARRKLPVSPENKTGKSTFCPEPLCVFDHLAPALNETCDALRV